MKTVNFNSHLHIPLSLQNIIMNFKMKLQHGYLITSIPGHATLQHNYTFF